MTNVGQGGWCDDSKLMSVEIFFMDLHLYYFGISTLRDLKMGSVFIKYP